MKWVRENKDCAIMVEGGLISLDGQDITYHSVDDDLVHTKAGRNGANSWHRVLQHRLEMRFEVLAREIYKDYRHDPNSVISGINHKALKHTQELTKASNAEMRRIFNHGHLVPVAYFVEEPDVRFVYAHSVPVVDVWSAPPNIHGRAEMSRIKKQMIQEQKKFEMMYQHSKHNAGMSMDMINDLRMSKKEMDIIIQRAQELVKKGLIHEP